MTDTTIPSDATRGGRGAAVDKWFWLGLTLLGVAFTAMEIRAPYFFAQDDALVGELPVVLLACRGVWQGLVPEYNPYTLLGSPLQAAGGVYPPLYAAYGIARHILHDEYATFEVFALLHIFAGYGLTWLFCRRCGVSPPLATLSGLTFVLSGPVIVMGRCWHTFLVPATFIPLFALLVDRLRSGPVGPRWAVGMGLAVGLYYHSGFPQLFVLGIGLMLSHALSLAAVAVVPWFRLRWMLPALAFGAALAVPVFHQQVRLAREIAVHDSGGGDGVGHNLLPMILPHPIVSGTLPNGWGSINLAWGGHLYYAGTILLAACLAGLVWAAWRWVINGDASARAARMDWARLPVAMAFPAAVAFLLALGASGGLWHIMGLLPVGLRNNPFRALPWFVFFTTISGARFCEDFIVATGWSPPRLAWTRAAVMAAGCGLLAHHLPHADIAFYSYGFSPYPAFPAALKSALIMADGSPTRVLSVAAMRSRDPSYPLAMPHNIGCLPGVPALHGYNPLVQRFGRYQTCLDRIFSDPAPALAAYGVGRVLIHRSATGGFPPQTPNRFEQVVPFGNLASRLTPARVTSIGDPHDVLAVAELPAAPLAFDRSSPNEGLAFRLSVAGIDIDLEPPTDECAIVANFLYYPDFVAHADGRPARIETDEWQRIVVDVPAGTKRVTIHYRPPWITGILLALVPAAFAAITIEACRRCHDVGWKLPDADSHRG